MPWFDEALRDRRHDTHSLDCSNADNTEIWLGIGVVIGVIPTFNCPAAFTDAHDPACLNAGTTIRFSSFF
ncbi:hypothetical protein HBI56_160150 [Parastagonospora nodorum]|nr:hypothetical protein HBH53_026040 [Parastagonospora nodorum]KAH3963743.1 hypothetical protein HBH51_165850 [Parastagonospora nodorum]KAH4022045.1 hypothetical protein HBI09_175440 [Parastagonospora nodorum]KAH4046879.1 hypothetical protein HBH49_182380 [Parastagonospora nodorum]KAH4117810.1 hypothetical protein HBH47_150620 [Parastagonospora nodorum]